ncbi:MAG TPA: ferritin family protein [Bdellovibrionota bacterium]|nr:ferritin family protein [Bdellovibrionota bacterium]
MNHLSLLLLALPAMVLAQQAAENTAESRNQTLKNLLAALQEETTASYRYEIFGQQAKREGFDQVSKLFRAASASKAVQRENHKTAIRALGGAIPDLKPGTVVARSTRQNLEQPFGKEKGAAEMIYSRFIRQAEQAGAPAAAESFAFARNAETAHEKLFRNALAQLGTNPPQEYFVNKRTGQTLVLPPGAQISSAQKRNFIEIG